MRRHREVGNISKSQQGDVTYSRRRQRMLARKKTNTPDRNDLKLGTIKVKGKGSGFI